MNGPLLRAPVLWLAGQRWFRWLAAERGIGRRVAMRFVAGEDLEDAFRAARALNRRGVATMLDHLGENVTSVEQASAAADAYVRALKRAHEFDDLDCNISVKLTQLGLDQSYDLCMENCERVLSTAAERGTLVMIDMESHEYVDPTLRAHLELKQRFPRVGLALQAYLYRTGADVHALPPDSIVRLVKGAYLEPPDVAFPSRADVDKSFARLFATLVSLGHTVHLATHDPSLVDGARRFVERRGESWERVEFQFLYGIRRDLQQAYARDAYPVRVYLPYGTEWYPYLTRRMAERPANMWFFASNLIRGG
ncbi:MAG: proline dehydrogenase family protein [Actinomycetota bacterium]|nr:proline dehydrogenase family protein [Actinomycetota bacterium]